jgi:hypothetical protein
VITVITLKIRTLSDQRKPWYTCEIVVGLCLGYPYSEKKRAEDQ